MNGQKKRRIHTVCIVKLEIGKRSLLMHFQGCILEMILSQLYSSEVWFVFLNIAYPKNKYVVFGHALKRM